MVSLVEVPPVRVVTDWHSAALLGHAGPAVIAQGDRVHQRGPPARRDLVIDLPDTRDIDADRSGSLRSHALATPRESQQRWDHRHPRKDPQRGHWLSLNAQNQGPGTT